MSNKKPGMHGVWVGRWTFILAATGSAVGLGNLWKFPYITGENGGGAFVLVYLACIFAVGVPVMLAEVLLGRKGRMSPIHTMESISREVGAPRFFSGIGWMGAISGFFILSFYSVIAGWGLMYVLKLAGGVFVGADAAVAESTFGAMVSDPSSLIIAHTLFMLMTGVVIAGGVNKGLENSLRIIMPLLFVLLVGMFFYSMTLDGFGQSFHFLFDVNFDKLSGESVVVALGHAFFTLSLGMGAIMAYGAYMPKDQSLGKTVVTVAALDTIVALVAGLVIFSIVFSNGLQASAGPGLMFQTLPLAFGNMPAGVALGTIFFVLVVFAAWSSAMSIAEPAVAWAVEKGFSRSIASFAICGFAWFIGLGTVWSFNDWSNYQFFVSTPDGMRLFADVAALAPLYPAEQYPDAVIKGKTFFDVLDFLTSNILLPLGGLLIAIFVDWNMSKQQLQKETDIKNQLLFNVWRFVLRYVSPAAVFYIFISGIA